MTTTERERVTRERLEHPTTIKRNYMTRTYSGANLLNSDRLSPIVSEVSKHPQSLLWFCPRNIEFFPKLEPIDATVEMRLMDIIMGDDPMNEGTMEQDDEKKRALLAANGLKEALWLAGKKRIQLQERHNAILHGLKLKLRAILDNLNDELLLATGQFQSEWHKRCTAINENLKIINSPLLAELRKDEYGKMKKDYQKMEKESWVLISDLETKLENIEKQRATSISSELSDCGHLLKKLNYQRHDVIDTRLQEEVTNYNQLLLTNRETIYEQLNYLRCIFQETKVKTVSYFKKADSEWAKIRYSYIHPIIYKEIENDLSFSFEDFYSSYQTQFNNFVKQEALQIDDMLHWNPSDSITNIVTSYQDVSKTIVTLQHDKIKEFTEEVSLIEKRFADKISNAYKYWLPRVKECSEQGASTLLDEINGLRKSSEIANGKHASISLYSKAARNNHLLSKIMEFLCCISLTKEQLINGQLLEVEVDIVSQLRDLNLQYESNKSGLEKDLQMEVSSLRLETKEILIKKRLQKSKEFIKSIIENENELFTKSCFLVHSLIEKSQAVFQNYRERLDKLINSDHVYDHRKDDSKYLENYFWQKKVDDWRQDYSNLPSKSKKQPVENDPQSKLKKINQKKSRSDDPNFYNSSCLLDRTPYIPMPDIITTLDSLGFSNSQITYTIDNYSGSTQEVVDIPPISHDMIHKGKIVLCETVKKDSLMLWDSILDRLKVKIDKKLDSLSQTKLERLALYESKNVELDEISKNRITKLPQIQGAHENEAKFIVDTIHSLRDDYTSTLKTIFKDTKDFLNFTANDTLTRLKKCRSIIEITRLRKQYSIMVEQFHLDVKEGMYKCNGSFSLGKKMLGRSKTQGNHSSAWLIIKEKGQYDPNTALTLMENWRITMEDEMGKIQKDVTNQIRFAQKEFESYLQDFELIEYVDAKLRKLRMLVKGEVIWGSKLQGEFQKSIEHYNTTLNATSTWKDILQLLNEARDIELSIAHFAKYLSYSKNSLSTANSFDSVVEEWDLWKHLPSMETALPQIGQHESEIKMTITPSNSELRSMIASAKPIPFHGGQDEENELITQESLDNINLFENQDSLPDILSSPRVESRGADLLEKEVSTKGTPPKVNKSVTIENTKSTNREDSKTNSKSNKIVKEETRPATKPSSKEDPKIVERIIPKLVSTAIGKDEVDEWDFSQQPQEKHLDLLFQKWSGSCKRIVMAKYENYLINVKDREIKKQDKIPNNEPNYSAMIDSRIAKIMDEADVFRKNQTEEFIKTVKKFQVYLDQTMELIFTKIFDFSHSKLLQHWKYFLKHYINSRSKLCDQKSKYLKGLKISMGHPENESAFNSLIESSMDSHNALMNLVQEFQNSCKEQFENISFDFINRLMFITSNFVQLIDNMLDISGAETPSKVCETVLDPLPSTSVSAPSTSGTSSVFNQKSNVTTSATVPSTSSSENPTSLEFLLPPLNLSAFPLEYIQKRYEAVQLPCKKSLDHYNRLIEIQTMMLDQFTTKVTAYDKLCHSHAQLEEITETQWMKEWDNRVKRVKGAYI